MGERDEFAALLEQAWRPANTPTVPANHDDVIVEILDGASRDDYDDKPLPAICRHLIDGNLYRVILDGTHTRVHRIEHDPKLARPRLVLLGNPDEILDAANWETARSYGRTTGLCPAANRPLTNAVSRARGIGENNDPVPRHGYIATKTVAGPEDACMTLRPVESESAWFRT